MTQKLLTIAIILFSITFMHGQKGKISGKVLNNSGKEIIGANVTIKKISKGSTTNASGEFIIENVQPGYYTLNITYIGYETKEVSVFVKSNETSVVPQIVLNESEEQLEEVVLEGHKNKYIVREPSQSLRLKTELVKQPQNIQVISSDLLLDQQATSIMDGVIRNVSGVTMLEHWGNFARVHMRGFRIPAFRNGFNFNDTWGPLSDDMAFVDRIEFVKGPAGFMMSAGEPGGFYNVVTKKPSENRIAQVSVMAGSFDTYRGTLDLGGKLTQDGKLLFRFNGLFQTADTHRGNEQAERFGFAPALTYKFSDRTSFTTEFNVHRAESFIGSAYVFAPSEDGYGSLDRDFRFTDTNYPATDIDETTLFLNFKHDFSDNWGVETQAAFFRYNQEGNSTWLWSFDTDTGDAVRYISKWDALSLGEYFQIYVYGKFNTGNVSHNVMGGFDFTDKEYYPDWNELGVIDLDEPFNIYNPRYGHTIVPEFDRSQSIRDRDGINTYDGFINRSFYVQDEISFIDNKVRLTLAGRYTTLSAVGKNENDTKFTPRVGLSVDVTPLLTAYALYDQSFSPTFGISTTGEGFDPEEASDIEGGIKANLFKGKLRASLGAFRIVKDGLLTQHPDQATYPNASIQLDEPVVSEGIEFDAQGEITPQLNITFNYANTKVIDEETRNRLAGHAKHVTNAWFNYNFADNSKLKGFGASLGYQYQIDRSTWAWGADNDSDLPDYFRLDGALSWHNDKFRVQANINNILNEYLYSGASYGNYLYWQSEPGINGRIIVTYKF